ncbi:hypothetical protein KIN_08780 [Litoreibacter roseus]|uniref:Uncharacterized protein n=1 Tax=Litoreibacter roseus TaxID=2601869 RepID=A0A6N6JCI9_9RHOB|nr:hypothetical protein KIN_08780 [Litoreibacter roseus]
MGIDPILNTLANVSVPPLGAVNVRIGAPVEGPGGRWVPCASIVSDGVYLPCLYEIGPGRRQVCGTNVPSPSEDEALSRAIELAATASA